MDYASAGQVLELHVSFAWWTGTLLWFCLLLFGDLYLHRKAQKKVSMRLAVIRSLIWIALGVLLGALIWWHFGHDAGTKYFSGYLIEKTLSVDNIFVWGVILSFLQIPKQYHYKVLFWGIFGAIVFRTIFVFAGVAIIENFEPALVFLGLLLFINGWRLLRDSSDSFDADKSRLIRFMNKLLPVNTQADGVKPFVRKNGKLMISLLFFAICIIELTDVIFAIDSVPAVLGIVRHPYLVLSSNIAAILGLRALYFVFEGLKGRFWLLNKGLAVILGFIGATLVLSPARLFGYQWVGLHISSAVSLSFIAVILTASIAGSLLLPQSQRPA